MYIIINEVDGSIEEKNENKYLTFASNCECECDKSFDIREYLDYKNCKRRNKIVDKLLEECRENIDGNEMIYNKTVNAIPLNTKVCNSCTTYIVSFVIFLIISISISSAFIYFNWYLKKVMFVLGLILVLKQQFNSM